MIYRKSIVSRRMRVYQSMLGIKCSLVCAFYTGQSHLLESIRHRLCVCCRREADALVGRVVHGVKPLEESISVDEVHS